MSTSAISPRSIQHKEEAYFRARHQDLDKLGAALESGDLAGAEQDYADIQNLGQQGPFPNGDAFLNTNREQDFQAVGEGLQSGDLTAARQAFGQLAGTFGLGVPPIIPQPKPVGPSPTNTTASDVPSSGSLSVNA
jgi:hypothetical protein